jgi:hypothetical protein
MARGVALRNAKKEAMWRRHVRGQASGGLSVRAYCAAQGLQECSFYWWRRELARREAEHPTAFVPVTVTAETPAPVSVGQVEIVWPGDLRVRVLGSVDKRLLADVLDVLAARAGGVAC